MAEKNMAIAMILSFLWTGLGLIYAGDTTRGIIMAIAAVVLYLLFWYFMALFGIFVFILWVYSMYATYKEVQAVNGA